MSADNAGKWSGDVITWWIRLKLLDSGSPHPSMGKKAHTCARTPWLRSWLMSQRGVESFGTEFVSTPGNDTFHRDMPVLSISYYFLSLLLNKLVF
jgi:hypothetical protein